jgi:hypothetical protein
MPTGFTYTSGQQTDTVSLRCPICLSHRPITQSLLTGEHYPTLEQLCCEEHVEIYKDRVMKFEKRLWLALRGKQLPGKVRERITLTGSLSNLASNFLKEYVQ